LTQIKNSESLILSIFSSFEFGLTLTDIFIIFKRFLAGYPEDPRLS
jgi:hypothetical protein